jgi:tetratricopeptide (TPR) repeat protein
VSANGPTPIEQALRLHQAGLLADAAARYQHILATRADDFDALQLLGALRCDQDDAAAAIPLLERALLQRDDPAVRLNLGRAWRAQGRLDEAERQFRLAANALPALPQAPLFLGLLLKETGRLAEAIDGFRRAIAIEPRYAEAHLNLGNALRQAGQGAAALDAYRQAALLRPTHVETHLLIGQVLQALGRNDAALAGYDTALGLAPGHGPGRLLRADCLAALGRVAAAVEDYRLAVAALPGSTAVYGNLGAALQRLGRLDEALACFAQATALAPGFVEAWYNHGVVLRDLGCDADAEASLRRALALAPGHAAARTDLALLELRRGDDAAGWRNYEARWQAQGFPGRRAAPEQRQWRGAAPIGGKTLRLHAEQGLGDTLQFCRYVPRAASLGATIELAVQPSLVSLLGGQFPGVTVVADGAGTEAADYHCPLLSLPLALGAGRAAATPYLAADPKRRAAWRDRLGSEAGLRVGLVWAGNPAHPNDRNRSIALGMIAALAAAPGTRWHSLQKKVTEAERATLRAAGIADCGDALTDFAETAALVSEFDLVIAVDTAVAHLAGALGRPVWILLPAIADWRWGVGRAETEWYPTARLFRQSGEGWPPVLQAVMAALRAALQPRGYASIDQSSGGTS